MAYTGDQLTDLNPNEPDGQTEPVSVLDQAVRQIKRFLRNNLEGLIQEFAYPVGSVYMNVTNDKDPSDPSILGFGTWTRIRSMYLVGQDPGGNVSSTFDKSTVDDGTTVQGGEENHQLTKGELPVHSHVPRVTGVDAGVFNDGQDNRGYEPDTSAAYLEGASLEVGNDEAHNNLPPYKVVHMWYRTA